MPLVTDGGWHPPLPRRRTNSSWWFTCSEVPSDAVLCCSLWGESFGCRLGTRSPSTTTSAATSAPSHGGAGGSSASYCCIIALLLIMTILSHCRSTCAVSFSVTSSINDMQSSSGTETSPNNGTWPTWSIPDPQQCVVSDSGIAEQVCRQPVWDRQKALQGLHLKTCSRFYVVHVYNPDTCRLQGSQNDCRSCLDEVECLDNSVYAMLQQFEHLLEAVDCGTDYSTHWRCKDCQAAYKDWLCSEMIPYYPGGGPSGGETPTHPVPPCHDNCDQVVKRCPYFLPNKEFQYAGEPTFICTGSPSSHMVSDLEHQVSEVSSGQRCHYPCTSPMSNDDIICDISIDEERRRNNTVTLPLVGVDSFPDSGSDTLDDLTFQAATSSASSIHQNYYHDHYYRAVYLHYNNHHSYGDGRDRHRYFFSLWSRHRTPRLVALQLVLLWFTRTLAHHRVIGLT